VNEIRIHAGNEYRVIYVAKFPEAVYVLHAFVKKTRKTPHEEIDLASRRYRDLLNRRRAS
jgi:phage-related protein